jgi:hypothetical protein
VSVEPVLLAASVPPPVDCIDTMQLA